MQYSKNSGECALVSKLVMYRGNGCGWTFASILSAFPTRIPGHIGVDEVELSVRPTEI